MMHRRQVHAAGEGLGVHQGVDLVYVCMTVKYAAEVYPESIMQESYEGLQEHRGVQMHLLSGLHSYRMVWGTHATRSQSMASLRLPTDFDFLMP